MHPMDPEPLKHPGGRPRKSEMELRRKRITVCVSIPEYKALLERAQQAGMGGALIRFVREIALFGRM